MIVPAVSAAVILAATAVAMTFACRELVDEDGIRAVFLFPSSFFVVGGAEAAKAAVALTGQKNRFSITIGHCRNRMASTTPTVLPP